MSTDEFRVIDDRLKDLDIGMAVMVQQIIDHTEQDSRQFGALGDSLSELNKKVDKLVIQEAERRGALQATRMTAAKWGASVGGVFVVIAEGIKLWVG